MRKALLTLLAVSVLIALPLLLLFEPPGSVIQRLKTWNMFVAFDDDAFNPGPRVGSYFPGVRALHNGQPIALLQTFAGPSGTVLLLEESPQDSPFSQKMLAEADTMLPEFAHAGLGLVALLPHDSAPAQHAFPVLLDQNELSARTLGIHNDAGDKSARFPGAIIIAPDGRVAATLFLANPNKRLSPQALLHYSREALASRQ